MRHARLWLRALPLSFWALIACAGVALLILSAPIFHADTHLTTIPTSGGTSDYYHFHWNFWWIRHVLETGTPLYEINYVFSPAVSTLAYHTLSVFWFPVWALVASWAGTGGGMTAVFFVALTLTGWLFYLWFRDEGITPGWALMGALVLEGSSQMISVIGWSNINLMGFFWLPILLLTWKRIAHRVASGIGIVWALALGVALWALILTDLQYALLFLPILVPYGILVLGRTPTPNRVQLIGLAVVAVGVALALLWGVGPLRAIVTAERVGFSPTPFERAVVIPFPMCFVGACDSGLSASVLTLPLVGVALAIMAIHRRRWKGIPPTAAPLRVPTPNGVSAVSSWFWLALVPIPLILSAGGTITVLGVTIPLPYQVLHAALGGMFRYPERFLMIFTVPALMFSLKTLSALHLPMHRRLIWIPPLFLLLFADSRLLTPLPLRPIPYPYAFYEAVGREPYDELIVEIPTGGSSGEGVVGAPAYSALQYYGIIHGKRMVNGHLSRVNTYHYFYMNTDDPMMAWLGQRRFLEPDTVETQVRERIPLWGIGYFVIHRDLIAPNESALNEIFAFFNSHDDLVCGVTVEGDLVAYRATTHPLGCPTVTTTQVDIGVPEDALFIGEGWHYPEVVGGITVRWAGHLPMTTIHVHLPVRDTRLTVQAQAFHEARRVALWVNDQPTGESMIVSPDALGAYAFTIPAGMISPDRKNKITFVFDDTRTPQSVGMGDDTRPLAIMVAAITIE